MGRRDREGDRDDGLDGRRHLGGGRVRARVRPRGDGTILRGAELSRGSGVPMLGVNLGHVGFLAEAEREDLDDTVERILSRDYTVEERMTLEVRALETVARSSRRGRSTR